MDSLVVYHNSLPAQTVVGNIETINTNQNGRTDENYFPPQIKFSLFSPLLPLPKNTEMADFHCRDNIAAFVTGMAGGIPLGRHGCHLWDGTTSICYHNCPLQLINPLNSISCRATTAIPVHVTNSDILYPRKLHANFFRITGSIPTCMITLISLRQFLKVVFFFCDWICLWMSLKQITEPVGMTKSVFLK